MDSHKYIYKMSIAELRKILKDNNIKETAKSKQELIKQVSSINLK